MESILTSIKKMLGITEEYTHFDADIIMHINSIFMVLNQLGVGPEEGFFIEDETTTWFEYIDTVKQLQAVKSYMYLRVKMLFDPSSSSVVMESMKQQANEMEFRLNIAVDNGEYLSTRSKKSMVLTDISTNEDHELYVDNGDLHIGKSEG